jgi:hypothetical protein
MTALERMLGSLQKVKGRNGSWTACCPAHNDKGPSLAIRETPDGRILLHCFAGCETSNIVASLGMDMTDLFPPDEKRREYPVEGKPKLKPAFYASDLMRIIAFEASVVMICAYDMSKGKTLSEEDRQRLTVARERIEEAVHYAGV